MQDMIIILPIVVSTIAICISIFTSKKSEDILLYNSLDSIYTKLMTVSINNPDFRNPHKTINYKSAFEGDRVYAYESYAFMAINMISTVHDRYKRIPDTWHNIIKVQIDLHKSWFFDNQQKFKPEFVDFINRKIMNLKKPY